MNRRTLQSRQCFCAKEWRRMAPRSRSRAPTRSPPRRAGSERKISIPSRPKASLRARSCTRACAPEWTRTRPSNRTCRLHGTLSGWRTSPSARTASGRGRHSLCDLPRTRGRGRYPPSEAPCTRGTAPIPPPGRAAPSSGSWGARRTTGRCSLRSRGASSERAWGRIRRRGPGRSCRQTPRSSGGPLCCPTSAGPTAPFSRRGCSKSPRPSARRR
mmetsp:Transcript_5513/g.14892  ORF Transcript_5513/g.14892 Transcript_5513/m.14892 type:complete len:215 (-) Transcript_5513:515-1159(-)